MHLQDQEETSLSELQVQTQEKQKVQILQEEVQACMEQVSEMLHLWTERSLCEEMPQQKGKVSQISSPN